MRHHKQLFRPLGELCKMCYKNNMMLIELHYCFIARTTGTTKTIYTAKVRVVARQEESDSTMSRTSETFCCNIKTWQFFIFLLDVHPLCFYDMFLEHVQGCMQVGGSVSCLEHWQQVSTLHWVGVFGIHQLKVHLEAAMPLVASKLDPKLIWRYCTLVPGQSSSWSG